MLFFYWDVMMMMFDGSAVSETQQFFFSFNIHIYALSKMLSF